MSAALIVTAELPPDLAAWATGLRRAHFPPERNFLDAHVTLFHALPPACEAELRERLGEAARLNAAPKARLEGLMNLGQGTALAIRSPEMLSIREELAEALHGLLTPQDRHVPRLHITIQNKVPAREAAALQAELSSTLQPRDFAFRGLGLHVYRGGPWDFVKSWQFRG